MALCGHCPGIVKTSLSYQHFAAQIQSTALDQLLGRKRTLSQPKPAQLSVYESSPEEIQIKVILLISAVVESTVAAAEVLCWWNIAAAAVWEPCSPITEPLPSIFRADAESLRCPAFVQVCAESVRALQSSPV